MATLNPTLIQVPFAESGDKSTIAKTSSDVNEVTQEKGWGSNYSQPLANGGKAPERKDMNGVFNLLSSVLFYAQKGWIWRYDTDQDYYSPALVWDDNQIYFCKQDVAVGAETHRPSDDGSHVNWILFSDYLKANIPVNDGTITINRNNLTTTGGTTRVQTGTSSFSTNDATSQVINIDSGNGKLTFVCNDTTIGTFYANQTTDTTFDLTTPGVYNGKLTINSNVKRNSTSTLNQTVDFTANSSTDKSIDINVGNAELTLQTQQHANEEDVTGTDVKPISTKFSANQVTDGAITIPLGNGQTTLVLNGGTFAFSANQYKNQTIDLTSYVNNLIGNGTLTITNNGVTAGTFSANQKGTTSIALATDTIPVGTVQAWAGDTSKTAGKTGFQSNGLPNKWLLCDGSSLSTSTYATLFGVIGYKYGGSGSSFNLPNLTSRFIEGTDGNSGSTIPAGLPDIKGMLYGYEQYEFWQTYGAFTKEKVQGGVNNYHEGRGDPSSANFYFSAANSNAIYGNSTTVQPPAVYMRYIIKYQ